MATRSTTNNKMRVYHRYLGFFLAGIMAVYALSGIVLIFRDTDFLKKKKEILQTVSPRLNAEQLGQALRIRELKFQSQSGEIASFKQGTYNHTTGEAKYTVTVLPKILDSLTKLHKANSKQPLFFLNIFSGNVVRTPL